MNKTFLFCLLLLTGCIRFDKEFAEVFFHTKKTPKEPTCLIWSEGFSGISDYSAPIKKIMLIHGVGTHEPGHSSALIKGITQMMNYAIQERTYKQIFLKNKENDDVGVLRIYRFFKEENEQLIFYELTWSSITEKAKKSLFYDIGEEFSVSRANLNAQAKKYADATLPDPLIYLGPNGQKMLSSVLQSLCFMMNYTYEELPQNAFQNCLGKEQQTRQRLLNEDFFFITHSLGSRMVIDAFQDIANQIQTDVYTLEHSDGLIALKQKNIPVFMLANQLPLLQMGRKKPKNLNKRHQFCEKNGTKYNKRLFKKLDIIAFSDPNDVLSYALEPNTSDTHLDSALCPEITNISIKTTPVIDILGLGQFANPLKAHKNYAITTEVIHLILFGISEKEQVPQNCRFIHLKGE